MNIVLIAHIFYLDTLDLPSADLLSPRQADPSILEVFGGSKLILPIIGIL